MEYIKGNVLESSFFYALTTVCCHNTHELVWLGDGEAGLAKFQLASDGWGVNPNPPSRVRKRNHEYPNLVSSRKKMAIGMRTPTNGWF